MKGRKILLIKSILILGLLLITQRVSMSQGFDGLRIIPQLPTPRVIMIFDKGLDTHLLSINRFTEVTWINDSNSAVKIEFGKAPDCKEISAAAFPGLGVRMQPEKCFITSPIPPKGTLRFRFQEFGHYKYKVEHIGTNHTYRGELKVF